MSNDFWFKFSDDEKRDILNSINQFILPKCTLYRPLEKKPRIRRLASGKWINTNSCLFWSDQDEWHYAIDWCERENSKLPIITIEYYLF